MQVLLLAGEGPYFKNSEYLDDTLFDLRTATDLERDFARAGIPNLRIENLRYGRNGESRPLLRSKRELIPHLTAFTMDSILRLAGAEYELFRLERVWDGDAEPESERVDAVFLSTTFICEKYTLKRAIEWATERFENAILVLGGQYSNLKFKQILAQHPRVDYIVRGDGEQAVPALLQALAGRRPLADVPNLAFRNESGDCLTTGFEYVDIDAHPSPSFPGTAPVVPYESMRGCPFSCKFCSFPFASPKWRYKSASKIAHDWERYADENGATHIRAMDSTFTVPYGRLRELLDLLPSVGVEWEAYSRANNLKDAALVQALEAARCRKLSIGFESMSDRTLGFMNKLVTAEENRQALELLRDSQIGYRISVMVGYPGERPEDYEQTHRFLVEEYTGHFMLSVFSFLDETMPVWADVERFQLEITDPENPDYSWRHVGMDVESAKALMRRTLDETRALNDRSLVLLWQTDYETPLIPELPKDVNFRLEKLVDRLGMAPRDHRDATAAAPAVRSLLGELEQFGIRLHPADGAGAGGPATTAVG